MIKLREYQEQVIKKIRQQFSIGIKKVIFQLATGGGKTICFSYMVKTAYEKGLNCLILTNRIELLEQAGGTFEKLGIQYENITADSKTLPTSKVIVAMVETLSRRVVKHVDFQELCKSIDLLIVDECHFSSFDKIYQYFSNDSYVIGATATPIRMDKKNQLSKHFQSIVEGVTIKELISLGFLARPKYFGVNVDLNTVSLKMGEYDDKEQEKLYSEKVIFDGLLHNLQKHANGLKTMIFCPNVQSSINVAKELNCLQVDGTMSSTDRDRILTEFENTPGSIIANCGILTTGYDCPTIGCIVLYRATTSLPLYLQMIGRGSRVTESKKNFVILDFGMNVQRHGYWHIDRTWTLEVEPKKAKNAKDAFPTKFCHECGAIVALTARTCDECGFVFPVKQKEKVFTELEELTFSEVRDKLKDASVEEMERLRIVKGYKQGFIFRQFENMNQFDEYAKLKGYKPGWASYQSKMYLKK